MKTYTLKIDKQIVMEISAVDTSYVFSAVDGIIETAIDNAYSNGETIEIVLAQGDREFWMATNGEDVCSLEHGNITRHWDEYLSLWL